MRTSTLSIMSDQSTPDIETTPSPAVSSLRSRFEKLASESSADVPFKRPPSSLATHDTLDAPSHHARTPSNASDHPPSFLRPASSSTSDMTAALRRPPPPPPSHRSVSPSPSFTTSPLIRPVPDSTSSSAIPEVNVVNERAQVVKPTVQRKPPPPPPPSQRKSAEGLSNKFQ